MKPNAQELAQPLIKVLGRAVSYRPGEGLPVVDLHSLLFVELGVDDCYGTLFNDLKDELDGLFRRLCQATRPTLGLDLGGRWGLTFPGIRLAKKLRSTSFLDLGQRIRATHEDTRDDLTWVVMELTSPFGESKMADGSLEDALRRDLRIDSEFPVFVPATSYHRGGEVHTTQLMTSYVFVATGLPEASYIRLESSTGYIKQVMKVAGENGLPVLSVIPNRSVTEMKEKLRCQNVIDLQPYDLVRVLEGKYANLNACVLCADDDDQQYATVRILELKSRCIISRVPRPFLRVLDCAEEVDLLRSLRDDDDFRPYGDP